MNSQRDREKERERNYKPAFKAAVTINKHEKINQHCTGLEEYFYVLCTQTHTYIARINNNKYFIYTM